MHWLLDAVDAANQKITGAQTSYADTEYATTQVADTISVIQATRTLIKPNTIYVTTADSGTTKFVINAYGPFMVTWVVALILSLLWRSECIFGGSNLDKLEKLAKLYKDKAITKAEFESMKARLLK